MRLRTLVIGIGMLGCGDDKKTPLPDIDAAVDAPATAVRLTLPAAANFVAFRDGDGEWQDVTSQGGPVYTGEANSDRYGFWIGCERASGSGRSTTIYRTIAETTAIESSGCSLGPPSPLTIDGVVRGLAADDNFEINSPWSTAVGTGNAQPYAVVAEPQPAELIGSRLDANFNPVSALRVDLGTINANVTRNLTFANAPAFVREPVTIAGLGATDSVEAFTGISTAQGLMFLPFLFLGAGVPTEVLALPQSLRLPTDQLDISVRVLGEEAGGVSAQRDAGTVGSAVPSTITLPSEIDFGNATMAFSPFSIGWSLPPLTLAATERVSVFFFGRNEANRFMIGSVDASPGWIASATELDLVAPRTIPAAVKPVASSSVSWSIQKITGDFATAWTASGTSGTRQTPAAKSRIDRSDDRALRGEQLRALRTHINDKK